jgi:hypothetical protein
MAAGDPPTPDAGRGEPERRRVTLREDVDGHVFAEYHIGAGMSSFFRLYTGGKLRNRLVALDKNELPQAARALRSVLDDEKSATVRDIGIEKVSFEADSGYVTVTKRAVGGPGEVTLFSESEARELLEGVETAIDDFDDVEDEPYV